MQDSVVKKEKTHVEKATQKALMFNIAFVATHSLIALIVGFLVSSQTILAEGITDLGATPLAILNIIVIKFIDKKNTKKYPFGKETLEPFIGIPNNVFLLVLSVLIIKTQSTSKNTLLGIPMNGSKVSFPNGYFLVFFLSINLMTIDRKSVV